MVGPNGCIQAEGAFVHRGLALPAFSIVPGIALRRDLAFAPGRRLIIARRMNIAIASLAIVGRAAGHRRAALIAE
ncbi:hypothetical protein [Paraburkholderia graminis]|uniref:Uncharacterized protein n=1 Tax=Paraburkholderia graminis TaxID=60548 RepID=A0ABD5CLP4_9BURK|nr:hypothetical protein [Paraburkholderia graminis]MDR6205993.1 hypothetical protein [Paraburkholderia graminis]